MADLNTLPNFGMSWRAASNYVGGAANAIVAGTSWTDTGGGNAWTGALANVNIRGRVQLSGIRANTGGVALQPTKGAGGTNVNVRNMGLVWVGQWPYGSLGQSRPVCYFGTELGGGHLVLRTDANGHVAISRQSNGSPQVFTGLRVPAGPTAIFLNSAAGEVWAKVLGQPAVAIAASAAGTANNSFAGLYGDPGGAPTERSWMLTDELSIFTAGTTVKANIDAIEADVIARYGLTIPTLGHVLCVGTSLGCGCYHGLGACWPGEVAASLPGWFVVNNSREGQTMANVLDVANGGANFDLLVNNPADRLLGADKPEVIIFELGANEVFNSVSLATMQAAAIALASATKAAKPRARQVWCTVVVIGSTAAKNTVRDGFNAWLLGGGLAAYGVEVCDVAGYDPTFQPASNTDGAVAACTGTDNFTTTDLSNNVGAGDHVHWSWVGFQRLAPKFVLGAVKAAAAVLGGTGKLLRYGRTAELGVGVDRLERFVN